MNNYMKTIISGLKQWVSAQITKSKSDWNQNDPNEINYVKNRTHYSYEKEIVFLPNTNLTENDVDGIGIAAINLSSAIQVGQEYKVIFNGSEYSCVGYTNTNVPGFIILGNMNIVESMIGVDFADTGEPFVVVYTSTRDSVANTYIYTTTVDSHTIKITYMGEAVKKIDKKYLPSMDYVSYNEEQNLTDYQMGLARLNIGAGTSDFDGNYDSLINKPVIKNDVVQYSVTQSLSDTNKSRARSNIGAVSENDVTALISDVIDPIDQGISDLNALVGSEKVSTQISNAINEAMTDIGGVGESTGENGAEIFNDYDNNIATGTFSHAEGTYTKAVGNFSHTEGQYTEANGMHSHAEGCDTVAEGGYSHTEGYQTTAYGQAAHAEGFSFSINPTITKSSTNDEITASWADASVQFTLAKGQGSHAEGSCNLALGTDAHAEGHRTVAIGSSSHAEGYQTIASGNESHIEGISDNLLPPAITSESTNDAILTQWEGKKFSMAKGYGSHVEGRSNLALNTAAHAEGYHTVASGSISHSEGEGTRAMSNNQHVQGKYNEEDANNVYAHIVGNGSSESGRSNAHTLDWSGNAWFAGDVYVGSTSGTRMDGGSKKLADEEYVDAVQGNLDALQIEVNKKALASDLTSHIDNKNNPHEVNLAQLGVTATAAELNTLDGITATVTELNYVDGVTSNIQEQLNGKQATITGAATTIASSNLTASRALVSDGSGKVAVSAVTSTELGYLDGVTSNIQTQLDNKAASSHGNHVPATQTANNATFLRNDNTWQKVTPANIGAAASSHSHTKSQITDFPSTETWTFTLEDGSTVTKAVYVG